MGNQLTTSTQKVVSRTALAMMLVLTLALMATTPAIAVVPPQLTHGTAVVDGSDAEWNLTDDFFAYMYRADNPNKPIESILYMRYDCATSTGYALVLAQTGVDVLMQPSDAFVRLGNSPKLVDGNAATFAWVQPNTQTGRAQGWEASFSLAPGSYPNLNVYTQVFDEESQTSAAADRSIPISIVCPVMTLTETPTLTGPSFGSCYNPEDQVFRLTVVNKATVAAYIGYDIYGKANSFVNLGRFDAGESKVFTVSEEGTLRKFISYDGQQWQQKGGTHVLSVAGHTTNNLLCKGSVSACKFNDLNGNGVQDANEPSIGDWQMSIYAGEIEDGEQPIASGVTNEDGFINFERLLPGQYTVCEGAVEGWLPTVSLCQSVTVLSEQETSVTFGNVRGGRIIVDKITDPAGAEDIFTFNLSKGAATTTFTLADASTPFDSGLILPGAYSIAELATEGWTLTDVTCVSVNENANVSELPNPVTISLQPGQVVQCTFTNTQDTPTETPTETNTPEPTPTDPTNTPEPTPTDPTNTPEPTPTDPTNTPEPTPTEDAPTAILSSECIVGEAGSWRYEWTVTVSRDDNYLVRFLDLNGNQVASREVAFRGDTPTPFTFEGDVTMLGRVEVLFGAALLAFDNGPFTSCAPPPPPAVGSLTVTKAVVWNEVAVTPVTFMICIQGASFPNGNEAGACTTFNENGGNHTWTDLVPGMYTITETGVDTDLWTVTGSGVSVEVVADAEATHTVTNTAIDVGGEGETPTALDPEDEPLVSVTQWVFLPTVLR